MDLKIEILCSSPDHPVNEWLRRWIKGRSAQDAVNLVHDKSQIQSGDLLFLISVSELIGPDIRARFQHTVVVHASDLPEGRGWSPHVWTILSGGDAIVVSALDAEEPVDSGAIWAKTQIEIPKTALCDEINERLFDATLELMAKVCDMIEAGEQSQPQDDRAPSYWPRRTPRDSEIDPSRFPVILMRSVSATPTGILRSSDCMARFLKFALRNGPDRPETWPSPGEGHRRQPLSRAI